MAERIAIVGSPAEAVVAAAAIAHARRLAGLPVRTWCSVPAADPGTAAEFVFAEGALGRSDLALLEWASGETLTLAPPADDTPLVVAGPMSGADRVLAADAVPVLRDRVARAWLAAPVEGVAPAPPLPSDPAPYRPVVAVVGGEAHFRATYPAVLLALGATAIEPRVIFVPASTAALPEPVDAVLLPGGASMAEVGGQIRAADEATRRRLPLLGLCLGMQCIATAAMRRGGAPTADLEEIAGLGPQRSFTGHPKGSVPRRLGEHDVAPLRGSRLAASVGDGAWRVRMNHRFRLNPTLLPALSDGGLRPAAWSSDGICEAVEGADGTGWCIGIQGHPELGTARQSARLFAAFVAAAARAGAA